MPFVAVTVDEDMTRLWAASRPGVYARLRSKEMISDWRSEKIWLYNLSLAAFHKFTQVNLICHGWIFLFGIW